MRRNLNQQTRRQFLNTAISGFGYITFGWSLLSCRHSFKKPNIIFIFTDDQRWDAMGCAGNTIIQTPHIDRLAREGVRFENAFVTTSICMASRGSAFTGLYERTHGWRDCGTHMDKEIWYKYSYPQLLREAGYYIGFVGKFDVDIERHGWKNPEYGKEMFDVYKPFYFRPVYFDVNGERKHRDNLEAEAAVYFIKNSPDDKPFCLSLWTNAPHSDHIAPARHYAKYADQDMPLPKLEESAFVNRQSDFIKTSMNRERWYGHFDTPERYQETVKNYYGQISSIDETVGKLRHTIEERNLEQNTVIIYASDNGYFLGDRGLAGKWLMYEPSIRIPLIIYDPRSKIKSHSDTIKKMALNIDLAPTILDLAGVPIPAGVHGNSLIPLLNNENIDWRTEFFYEHRRDCPENLSQIQSEGIRTEKLKYIRYVKQSGYEELFDLESDPQETTNLAKGPTYQRQLLDLRDRCDYYAKNYSK